MPRPLFLILAAGLAFPAFAAGEDDSDHLSERDGVRILHAWAVPDRSGLQVYMEIQNAGESEIVLQGGETHDGGALALMATEISAEGGAVPIGEIPITPGADMDLEPGGLYLRLDDAPGIAAGAHLDAHVMLQPVGEIEIEIEVMEPGTRQHPHAGHNH